MIIHNIPEDVSLTTARLRQYELRCGGKRIPLDLREEGSTLVHQGKPIPREDYWLFLPAAEARSLTLAGHRLLRTGDEPQWRVGRGQHQMNFTQPGQWIETLSFAEEDDGLHIVFRRYEATDDPDSEKTGDSEMITNRLTRDGEVVGVLGYREKLYIPRMVAGQIVTRVNLPYWSRSKYLREVVIEEGIELVDIDFDCKTLEVIRIPEGVRLAKPPFGIRKTAWYRAQPLGDIYFCGYYCGTKGPAPSPVLRMREGTIGILDNAYGGDDLRQVILPDSLAYVGKNAFAQNLELMRILLPESAQDLSPSLKKSGTRVITFPGKSVGVCPAAKDSGSLSGYDLYALGRTGRAARAAIPACGEPLAPKLTYEDGWIAHYYYAMEDRSKVDYLLSLRVPSGDVVRKVRFNQSEILESSRWSRNRTNAHYYWAAAYLAECAALIRKGKPTAEELERLERKWGQTHPDRLKNSIYDLEHPPAAVPVRIRARKKWKKIQFGKEGVSIEG